MEKKSKLVLAVLQGSDSDNTIRNLNEQGFMVTVRVCAAMDRIPMNRHKRIHSILLIFIPFVVFI